MSDILKQNAGVLIKKAYYRLIDEIAENQETVVKIRNMTALFGNEAITVEKRFRTQWSLREAASNNKRRLEVALKSLEEKKILVRELEKLFEAEDAADIQAFAEFIKGRMKESERQEKKKKAKA